MDAYDNAVDSALEREDNVQEYLNWKSGKREDDPLQILLAKCAENLARQTCENCGADPCICHEHRCQQCDKLLTPNVCVCANPGRMDWCSSNCRAAFDL